MSKGFGDTSTPLTPEPSGQTLCSAVGIGGPKGPVYTITHRDGVDGV